MSVEPGDVVVADFPGGQGIKRRPAVVVSSSAYHVARPDVILAVLTSQVSAAESSTDYVLLDWQRVRLRVPTAFRAFLITLPREDLVATIGRLSQRDWQEVRARLQLALAV